MEISFITKTPAPFSGDADDFMWDIRHIQEKRDQALIGFLEASSVVTGPTLSSIRASINSFGKVGMPPTCATMIDDMINEAKNA